MSVWWGRCREGVVYSVPKEVEWYECVVGRYMEVMYGVPKEVEWYECVVGKVYSGSHLKAYGRESLLG